jgi:proteic killer suppression protein
MWEILESTSIPKTTKKLPKEILKRYEKWKDIIRYSGPQGLKLIRGFNDEALKGELKGFRSSRLNDQYRVIYRVEKDEILVKVIKVAAHDYRRK